MDKSNNIPQIRFKGFTDDCVRGKANGKNYFIPRQP